MDNFYEFFNINASCQTKEIINSYQNIINKYKNIKNLNQEQINNIKLAKKGIYILLNPELRKKYDISLLQNKDTLSRSTRGLEKPFSILNRNNEIDTNNNNNNYYRINDLYKKTNNEECTTCVPEKKTSINYDIEAASNNEIDYSNFDSELNYQDSRNLHNESIKKKDNVINISDRIFDNCKILNNISYDTDIRLAQQCRKSNDK